MGEGDAFRAEVRAWLEANCPAEKRGPMAEDDNCFGGRHPRFKNAAQRLWLERMGARGWTAPTWPKEYGGGGLSAEQAQILEEEMGRIQAHRPLTSLGIWMLGPALLKFGTEAQKQKYLPPIIRGEVWWCQGYSEPNAGSDLASLRTRAERIGDEYVVNGQKIWTSYGHLADCIFCLVRTDPDKPQHDGISFLLIDMTSSGVKASPLKLLSGQAHFSQVFFDDVHVPAENLVGVQGRGWDVAKYLLLFERQMIGSFMAPPTAAPIPLAIERLGAEALRKEPMLRAKVTQADMDLAAFECLTERIKDEMAAGAGTGAKGSLLKYLGTELGVDRWDTMLSVLGVAGMDMDGDSETAREWLQALANRMGGGTSEIQLNVVAKRVLGLPGG